MYQDIMAAMTRVGSDTAALDLGIRLARRDEAHLAVLIPVEFPVPVPNEWGVYPYQMYSAFYDSALKTAEELAEKLRPSLMKEAIKFDVRVVSTALMTGAQTCSMHARYCDLVIVAGVTSSEKNYGAESYFVELLMNSGRPLIRVPHAFDNTDEFERVLIAWQPYREASRAVNDAMPFLKRAKTIDILMVNPKVGETEHGEQPGADIATHLAHHGLNVRVVNEPQLGDSVGDAIVKYASQTGAQLLVAGGYSHSRVRELILGGVTKDLSLHSPIPILFSH